ncbi:phosphate signaling complex protein PhoU [Oceanobacillus halotolerans]|uniref:phosphate signaling complex protein PhoU n=1 Tax=Oceanobacillus halotolerans TaxID=2663380 RepID=UPI0013DA6798|nr:phosphate signaling complex protein PhoU [Oceanobacillus halotolerans]
MEARESFDEQLDDLKGKFLELADHARLAVDRSITALNHQDIDVALKVLDDDDQINQLEEEINEMATWLIAKEQPLASDLRKLITTIKLATDLERIGDLAVNIAKSVIRIGEKPFDIPVQDIPKMVTMAREMIDQVLEAYNEEDIRKAKQVAETDDHVDQLYGKLIKELLEYMSNHPSTITQITQLAFICRYIERIADHTTNISEGVIYLVKGKRFDLNQ